MSQVTDPVILDSTGQDIVAKLQDVIDAINGGTIDPLTVTQNGTYTPSGTTIGYDPVTVDVQGGGGAHNYSTTEQVIGTWIDGKPIYELTVITSSRSYDVTSLAIDLLIFADGYGSDSSGYAGNKWTYTAVTNNSGRLIYLSADRKTLYLNGSYSQYGFTIQYTKTTDQAVS